MYLSINSSHILRLVIKYHIMYTIDNIYRKVAIMKMNLTMLTDFYELTMLQGYFDQEMEDCIATFDMYFRKVPDDGGYAIMAGVEPLIEYLQNLTFSVEDIEFLRGLGLFGEPFLDMLSNFNFTCDVYAVPEGTPIFPNEPIVTVKGPIIQAQFIETMVLLTINHQSLIATKTSRIVHSANGLPVVEFGARRAHGYDASIYGARAAYIGGAIGTSCTYASLKYRVPLYGTMAHSWVQMFDTEYEAFAAYAKLYVTSTVLLIDTYDVLSSGIVNAIKVAKDILEPQGQTLKAVRIDSGDIAYLSKQVRTILDENGMSSTQIMASNSLDEKIIQDLQVQKAKVDIYGVGERLICAKSDPVFGGVYKLVSINKNGQTYDKIKISENVEKITNPCFKRVMRLVCNKTSMMTADVVALHDEAINDNEPYGIFHPTHTWQESVIEDYTAKDLLVPIFVNGQLVYDIPTLEQVRTYSLQQKQMISQEIQRLVNPDMYPVRLSSKLWHKKEELIIKYRPNLKSV